MSRFTFNIIISFVLSILLLVGTCGCKSYTKTIEYGLILDLSASNMANIKSDDFSKTIQKIKQKSTENNSRVHVIVAAANPLELNFEPKQLPEPDQLLKRLFDLRKDQVKQLKPDNRLSEEQLADEDYLFGYGTNLQSAIARLLEYSPGKDGLFNLILITDGIADEHDQSIYKPIQDLVLQGPIVVSVLGVSQQLVDTQTTFKDAIEQDLTAAGLTRIRFENPQSNTFYTDSSLFLPRGICELY